MRTHGQHTSVYIGLLN